MNDEMMMMMIVVAVTPSSSYHLRRKKAGTPKKEEVGSRLVLRPYHRESVFFAPTHTLMGQDMF
jgi:hypothetical protein